jgi:hypothetical protein
VGAEPERRDDGQHRGTAGKGDLVAAGARSTRDRDERIEMAAPTREREENAHQRAD